MSKTSQRKRSFYEEGKRDFKDGVHGLGLLSWRFAEEYRAGYKDAEREEAQRKWAEGATYPKTRFELFLLWVAEMFK